MRPVKLSFLLITTLLLSWGCNAVGIPPQPPPTATPTTQPTFAPFPTLTPAPTPIPPPATTIPIPEWVADFSDPILKAVANRRPHLKDEFSPFNQGWFIFNPENVRRPYYARVKDGALFLELPETITRKDLTVYNPKLLFKNFVLEFDFKFGKTEPDDILRFQFGQSADQSVVVELSKNESWTFYWNLYNSTQSTTGSYDYFAPEYLRVIIIMQGNECAVYLNHDPVDYLSNCRPEPLARLSRLTMTFHLLGTGRPALVVLDHLKLWDLDKIPGLR